MAKKLLIVESPGKIKTLRKILGREWLLEASVGHTTELAQDGRKRLGFDFDHGKVTARYVPRGTRGRQVLAKLRQAVRSVDQVYLATDPDREGEAIAWHLVEQLGLRNFVRVTYTQITESAVKKAIATPRGLDLALIRSQRARQCLDKLVGFEVSPLLWRTTGGKSAGRVQSATLHLICERERERLAFKPEDYWTLKCIYAEGLEARFEPVPPSPGGDPNDASDTGRVRSDIEANLIAEVARTSPHIVKQCDQKEERRSPPPPFVTSSLQQAAGARFRYSPQQTMKVAQQLYEGINGKGLITYMRTDAVTLSPEFIGEARDWLKTHSPESLPERPPYFRSKADAQGAHEAIRPTHIEITPHEAKSFLNREQAQLYQLIWERSIACQCRPAVLSRTTIVIQAGDTRWVARGSTIVEMGYLKYWKNTEDERDLPKVQTGQKLGFKDVLVEKKTTQPPSRYSEPKLIQLMEKSGIGRPSTYASTLATLKERDYVVLDKNLLAPTDLGMATDSALTQAIPELVNVEFTAAMEASLDLIAESKLDWEHYLTEWNGSYLEPALVKAKAKLKELKLSAPAATHDGDPGLSSTGSKPISKTRAKLDEGMAKAKRSGPLPICAAGHGELKLALTRKGGYYWKCPDKECKNFAYFAEYSSEKCPVCQQALEKVPSRKVMGGYFLKCGRKDAHPTEVVLFRDRKTKAWVRPGS